MGPGERVELKKRIADELAQRPMHEIDLILHEFNQPTSDFGDWQDDQGYVLDMLSQAHVGRHVRWGWSRHLG